MEFGKPKIPTLPKLPSLAFWKSGEDSELPPPPARHFDPSRFGGGETQVADQAKPDQSKFDQYGMRVKDSSEAAKAIASKGFKFPKETVEELNSKPMRKPYGLDDIGGDDVLAKTENKFDLDSAILKSKIDSAKSTASNQLSGAQQDFRSAMNSAANSGSATKNSLSSDSNSFASKAVQKAGTLAEKMDNSFAAPLAKTIDTSKGIAGGSFLPESMGGDNVKLASAAGSESLYDARGQLKSAASRIGDQVKNDFAQADVSSMKKQFEQRLLAAQKQTEMKSEAFKSGALNASDQLTALTNVSPRTKDLVSQPFPKIAADGSLIQQKPSQTFDLNASQAALQPSGNPDLKIAKPNSIGTNSFGGNPIANDNSISAMRSEVENAKREIAALKAQVAAAKQSAIEATKPVQRVAQNTIEGVVLPLNQVNDAYNPRAGLPVANQYQGQQYSPSIQQPQSPVSPFNGSNAGGGSNSFYPATPHGGFGSNSNVKPAVGGSPGTLYGNTGSGTKPQAIVGQAGFNSQNEFQNRVSQASAEEPASIYSGPLQASQIGSTATEVIIPSSILTGGSGFAPGSTAPLQ